MLKQNAERTGGKLALHSESGKGTTVRAGFGFENIDRPALGDMAGVFLLSAIGHGNIEFIYNHVTGKVSFTIRSSELKDLFGDVPLSTAEVRQALRELIINNPEMMEASK